MSGRIQEFTSEEEGIGVKGGSVDSECHHRQSASPICLIGSRLFHIALRGEQKMGFLTDFGMVFTGMDSTDGRTHSLFIVHFLLFLAVFLEIPDATMKPG